MNQMYTCSVRKISTGHKLMAFQGDNLQHLHNICTTLMQSPNYSRCYIVCVDWQGNTLFNIQPQGGGMGAEAPVQVQVQVRQLPPAPQPPSWAQYQQQQVRALPAYPRPAPQAPVVLDAEFDTYAPPSRTH